MPASFSAQRKPPPSDGSQGPRKERLREKKRRSNHTLQQVSRRRCSLKLVEKSRMRTSQSRVQLQENGRGSDARPVSTAAHWKQTGSQWSAAPSITAGPLTSPLTKKRKKKIQKKYLSDVHLFRTSPVEKPASSSPFGLPVKVEAP